MKTSNENFEAFVLPIDQLYAISGGNDGECDPIECDAYDAGLWVGEGIKVLGGLIGSWKAFKSLKKYWKV
ncbi:MAG TPA: hypothetical protein VJ953_10170 [Saprospiraceae bacterium]|nr:hypothetical protein [Saprospiraceae bacterium]